MNLLSALRANPSDRFAFTGSGGKTAAVFSLANDFRASVGTAFVTTTTHLGEDQAGLGDLHLKAETPADLDAILHGAAGIVVVTGAGAAGGRVAGPPAVVLEALAALARERNFPLIVEADGSRRRPLKAPGEHEPVVPEFSNVVVVCAGLSGLGQPLTETTVHRPEIFAALTGLAVGDEVTPEALAALLVHPEGGQKAIPPGARRSALLNQAHSPESQAKASRIAARIAGHFDSILIASMLEGEVHAVREPAAAIVLAAGGSSRFGEPKQLLDWGGVPLVVHTARLALAAGCDPVVVVTGAARDQVRMAVRDLEVREVFNPDWTAGQSTSVKAGIRALADNVGCALFMLVDQPFVEPAMLRLLIETHARSLSPIVAPLIDQQRGNPVLFDRSTFPDFEILSGDAGGRQLFSSHRVAWVPWHNALALRDIDTLDDYARLKQQ